MERMSGFLDETAALCRKYGLPDTQLVRGAGELRGYHVRAAVLGGFNTGKSALVNALAGAYLSRVSLCGETRVPAEIFYGTQGVQVVRNGAAVRSDPSVLRQGGALDGAQLVRAAKRHVALHLDAPLALDGLARDLLTSRSRLCAAFKQETGCSLGAYVRRARMRRACELLPIRSLGVADVARAVGYPLFYHRMGRFTSETADKSLEKPAARKLIRRKLQKQVL